MEGAEIVSNQIPIEVRGEAESSSRIPPPTMCTLALFFRAIDDYPLLVAANRDEHLDRPSASPGVLLETPWVFGGKDLQAGGTWLGVNGHGMFVGILNRSSGEKKMGTRSRGLLCLDLLKTGDPAEAKQALMRQDAKVYNPFNLVFASATESYVAHNAGERIECISLDPGVHVVGNVSIYDRSAVKTNHASGLFSAARERIAYGSPRVPDVEPDGAAGIASLVELFRGVLSDHQLSKGSTNPRQTICVHGGDYGTVSSSVLILAEGQSQFDYFHAPGPPCRNEFERCRL